MDNNKTYGFFWKVDFDNYYLGHQAEEIFKQRIYAPYLENKKDPVVLDIGGNIGLFTLYAQKYAKQVYIVEPSSEHMENIERMILFNEFKNVKPIKKAIYIEDKVFPLFHNKNKTMYSLHQNVNDDSSPPEQVEAVTLETLFKDEGIEHVDLMKIDIEGSEIEVLSSLGFKNVADKIDVIVGESHSWSGRHANQLKEALKFNGFSFEMLPKKDPKDADIWVAKRNG